MKLERKQKRILRTDGNINVMQHQNDVAITFSRNNDVIIASCHNEAGPSIMLKRAALIFYSERISLTVATHTNAVLFRRHILYQNKIESNENQ